MENLRTFEELKCWQSCRALRLFVSKSVVPKLPKEERYRLADQLLRAARSTTANIAEGYGRFHHLDNAKFCSNARGSLYEVLDHCITGHDEELVTDELLSEARELVEESLKITNGYIAYLKKAHEEQKASQRTS